MRIVSSLVVTIVASQLTAACGGSTHPPDEWIAFQGNSASRYGIQLIRPDGSQQHAPLTTPPTGTQENPDWSPDGTRLAYTNDQDDGTSDVWVADIDGAHAQRVVDCVAPCTRVDEPAWSPSGDRIAFTRTVMNGDVGISSVEVVTLTGGISTLLRSDGRTDYYMPRWSPDGRFLVVEEVLRTDTSTSGVGERNVIGVLDVTEPEKGLTMITPETQFSTTPDWSPKGDLIVFGAFAVEGRTEQDLFTIRPDGSDRRRVTRFAEHGGYAIDPTFTPDGTRIVFGHSRTGGTPTMATIRVDGSDLRSATGAVDVPGPHPRLRRLP